MSSFTVEKKIVHCGLQETHSTKDKKKRSWTLWTIHNFHNTSSAKSNQNCAVQALYLLWIYGKIHKNWFSAQYIKQLTLLFIQFMVFFCNYFFRASSLFMEIFSLSLSSWQCVEFMCLSIKRTENNIPQQKSPLTFLVRITIPQFTHTKCYQQI